jgi:hypothetical protein
MLHPMSTDDYCVPPWARPRRVLSQHRLLQQASAEVRALREQLAATPPLARRRVFVHRLLLAGRRLSAILAALGLDDPPVPEPAHIPEEPTDRGP